MSVWCDAIAATCCLVHFIYRGTSCSSVEQLSQQQQQRQQQLAMLLGHAFGGFLGRCWLLQTQSVSASASFSPSTLVGLFPFHSQEVCVGVPVVRSRGLYLAACGGVVLCSPAAILFSSSGLLWLNKQQSAVGCSCAATAALLFQHVGLQLGSPAVAGC